MADFKVPFIDLQQRFQEEKKELLACVERVLSIGHLVLTPEVAEFEKRIGRSTLGNVAASGTQIIDRFGEEHMKTGKPIEEPLAPEDFRGYAQLVRQSAVEIATGEKLDSIEQYLNLMELGTLRIIQPDVTRAGGITGCLRIVANAEARGVTVIPHCWSCDILVAATLQLIATMPACPYLEFNVMDQPLRRQIIAEPFVPKGGVLEIPRHPGLGIELNRDLIDHYRWEG